MATAENSKYMGTFFTTFPVLKEIISFGNIGNIYTRNGKKFIEECKGDVSVLDELFKNLPVYKVFWFTQKTSAGDTINFRCHKDSHGMVSYQMWKFYTEEI